MKKRVLAAAAITVVSGHAMASSHREAPMISRDPAADLTDVYVFKSPERPTDFYTFAFNVSPGYVAYAGPNWYGFDDDVLYELHIDNTGDAVEDVTYQFKFSTNDYRGMENKGLIVANFPIIAWDETKGRYVGLEDGGLGAQGRPALLQTYTVTKVVGGRRSTNRTVIAENVPVAPPRIGPHTTDWDASVSLGFAGTPRANASAATNLTDMYNSYKTLADHAIKSTDDGSKFFAGPRNDPFFVDLGAVFDRVSPRITGVTGVARDALKGVNTLSVVFEVPYGEVFGAAGNNFMGVWATTSRPQAKILRTGGQADLTGGGYVQISRLGNPLVNEVVIKVGDKDKFNNTEPKDDAANYAPYVTDPQLAFALNVLYSDGQGVAGLTTGITSNGLINTIPATGRTDLVDVFVTGIPGVNKHTNATATGGDMIRVNKAISANALGVTTGSGGAIGPEVLVDLWPVNGRTLRDDVVATSLSFLANCEFLRGTAILKDVGRDDNVSIKGFWSTHDQVMPTSGIQPANCLLDDFVTQPDATPGSGSTNGTIANFPYIDVPHSSYYERTTVLSYSYP